MYFETTVTLPEGSEDSPLTIDKFETDVPNTSHAVDFLSKILFTEIKLAATNAPVHAQVNLLIYHSMPGPYLISTVHPSVLSSCRNN